MLKMIINLLIENKAEIEKAFSALTASGRMHFIGKILPVLVRYYEINQGNKDESEKDDEISELIANLRNQQQIYIA